MTDTTACPTCGAQVPTGAAFCTSCGERLAGAAPAAPPPPGFGAPPAPAPEPPSAPPPPPAPPVGPPTFVTPDPTAVGTPGLHDPTQLQPPVGAPASPWGAGDQPSVPTGPPTTAPWNPPAAPAAPSWQQPVPPPEPQAWAGPGGMAPATVYGTAAVASGASGTSTRSIFGGLATILGAALTLGGIFSPWVDLDGTKVSGWSLTTGDELLKTSDPLVLAGLALAAIVGGLLLFAGVARTVVRIGVILIGLAIVAVTVLDWLSIASFVEDNLPSSFEATAAVGFYLAGAGGVLTAIGGLLPASKSS